MPNAAFTALLNDVYTITGRPDLTAESSYAVRAATLKLHQSEFYPRDLKETAIRFSTPGYFQTISYSTLFPRFRSLSYVRKFEGGEPTNFLKVITPTNVLDSYNVDKENVCYLAGDVIQIRSLTSVSDILLGFYENPITLEDTYDSWIADLYPFAITTEAAATVFKMIGKDEETSMYRQLAAEHTLIVRNSNILAEGF